MDELAIKIENVSKEYRLGAIGGGTLKGDLQTWWARKRGKEDPNAKIGTRTDIKVGERFLALDDINLEVKKGEALGIIGHNGAGKSTLLKLLSRVTAPTTGTIGINGRIATMLEVGTGFHPELTGRENVYMNGAILGMSKKEIDEKIEEIIKFSEVRQFIDTPVKRYSSGMYVKLAFSVAAHLDSEIMIMDEVLAVGDMAFQKKCLSKMREAAEKEGRTVLYVSHNMNTIRQLCDRCIVLSHGKIAFEGEVEKAITLYMGNEQTAFSDLIEITPNMRDPKWADPLIAIQKIKLYINDGHISTGDSLKVKLWIKSNCLKKSEQYLRIMVKTTAGVPVTMSASDTPVIIDAKKTVEVQYDLNLAQLIPASYYLSFVLFEVGELGVDKNMDVLRDICSITVIADEGFNHGMTWNPQWWGNVAVGELRQLSVDEK